MASWSSKDKFGGKLNLGLSWSKCVGHLPRDESVRGEDEVHSFARVVIFEVLSMRHRLQFLCLLRFSNCRKLVKTLISLHGDAAGRRRIDKT